MKQEVTLKRMLAMPDVGAGLIFIVAGAAGLWFGRSNPVGSLGQMGPGFFPAVISVALIGIGAIVALQAKHDAASPPAGWPWRGLLLIPAGMILFSLLVPTFGIIPATAAIVVLSGLATGEARIGQLLLLAMALTAFSTLVFVYGLGLGFRVVPWD